MQKALEVGINFVECMNPAEAGEESLPHVHRVRTMGAAGERSKDSSASEGAQWALAHPDAGISATDLMWEFFKAHRAG